MSLGKQALTHLNSLPLVPYSGQLSHLLIRIVLSTGSQWAFYSGGCGRDNIAFSASSDLFFSIYWWVYAFLCFPLTFNVFIEPSFCLYVLVSCNSSYALAFLIYLLCSCSSFLLFLSRLSLLPLSIQLLFDCLVSKCHLCNHIGFKLGSLSLLCSGTECSSAFDAIPFSTTRSPFLSTVDYLPKRRYLSGLNVVKSAGFFPSFLKPIALILLVSYPFLGLWSLPLFSP